MPTGNQATSVVNEAASVSAGSQSVDPIRLAKTDVARMVKEAKTSCKVIREKWLKVANEGDAMFAGHQWAAADEAYLNDKRRPLFSFNYILRTVLGILGLEIGNRQQPLIQARNPTVMGQNELAELATEITKFIWDQTEGDEHFTLAFFDNLRRGMSWLELYMDYDSDADGVVKFKRVNGIQMYWDVAADEPNLANSFWRMRSLKMPWRQVEMLWGKDTANELRASMVADGDTSMETVHNISPVGYLPGSDVVQHDAPVYGDVTIDQFQYYTWEEAYQGLDPEADPNDPLAAIVTVDREGKKALEMRSAELGKPNPVLTRMNKKTFKQAWVAGKVEIESSDLPINDFTFQCMTGIRDEKEHLFFGIVEVMKDPQRFRNKFMSAAMDNFSKSLKHPLLIKAGAVDNPRRFEDEITGPGAIAVVNDTTEAAIRQLQSSDMPPTLAWLFQACDTAVQGVTGLPLELFGGSTNRDEGAPLDRQRMQNAISTMSPFFASEKTCRLRMAKLVIEYTRKFMGDGRMLRLTNEATRPAMQLYRDAMITDYNTVLDDNPRNPVIRMAMWQEFQPFLMLAARQGMYGVVAKMFKFAPWPADIVDDIAKSFEGMQQQMQQNPQQPQTGQQAGRQSPELNAAKAEKLHASAQLDQAKAQAQIEALRLKGHAVGMELNKSVHDMQMDERKLAHDERKQAHNEHTTAQAHHRESNRDFHKASSEYGKLLTSLTDTGETSAGK